MRSERALAALGLETALDTAARLEAAGQDADARRLRDWLNCDLDSLRALLRLLPATRGGHTREERVALCGVAFVARRADRVGFARRGCKDRLCPTCSARRSRRFAAALRLYVASRDAQDVRFVTLTQPKVRREPPRDALDRLLGAWRAFRRNAWGRRHILGGVRALEVTARRAGQRIGDYVVRVPGVHAHLHTILEIERGVRAADIAAAWGSSCAGASRAGVDVQVVSPANIYQCAKYPLDMGGLLDVVAGARDYVVAVLDALRGRRLVEAFGAWRGAPLGLREDEGSLVYGDRALATIVTGGDALDGTFRWSDGRVEQVADVLAALLDGPREPL